jgi:hypothetical protein
MRGLTHLDVKDDLLRAGIQQNHAGLRGAWGLHD